MAWAVRDERGGGEGRGREGGRGRGRREGDGEQELLHGEGGLLAVVKDSAACLEGGEEAFENGETLEQGKRDSSRRVRHPMLF